MLRRSSALDACGVRSRRPKGGGQGERDAGAALWTILGPDPSAVRLDHTSSDRESEACPAAATRTVGSPEAVEHLLSRSFRKAVSGVFDAHDELAVAPFEKDCDRAVGRGVAERIGEEVEEDALDL